MARSRALASACAIALLATLLTLQPERAQPAHASGGSWPMYHGDIARTGDDTADGFFTTQSSGGWTHTGFDGEVYGTPLVYNGLVFAATENNTIYALHESTGSEAWHTNLGAPVANSRLGCGNVDPVGITSTMVIDAATGILYAVGLVSTGSSTMEDRIWALQSATGIGATPWSGQSIDTAGGIDPRSQGQRAALAIGNGYVYVPFGGRYGDCRPYHPEVVAVNTGSGGLIDFQPQDPATMNEAGIWGPSGPAIDNSGNVYVSTGNGAEGNCANPWDYSEGVLKLSPTLTLLSNWHASNWCDLNVADSDVGSIGPSLLNNLGRVFQDGKPGEGYLLSQSALGGLGGELFSGHVDSCPSADAIFGGNAYDGARVYVPCNTNGLVALNVSASSFSLAWQSPAYDAGAPIVAGGKVWSLDQNAGTLHGFNPITGHEDFTITVGSHQHFQSLAAADGYVFVGLHTGVQAVKFTTALPGGFRPTPSARPAAAPSPRPAPVGLIPAASPTPRPAALTAPITKPTSGALEAPAIQQAPPGVDVWVLRRRQHVF